jgi:hypothetical protein
MDETSSKKKVDFLFGDLKLGRKEADQMFKAIIEELERQITFLKSKFKTEEAFEEFLSMLSGKNNTVH